MATRERFRGGGPHEASEADTRRTIRVTVNGQDYEREVEDRHTLADFLREDLGLTGTHVGCEHGVCGACTVLVDGDAVRACLMFAVQADGRVTRSKASPPDGELTAPTGLLRQPRSPVRLLHARHRVSAPELLRDNPTPTRDEVREGISGNMCRCTGYQHIVEGDRGGRRGASGWAGGRDDGGMTLGSTAGTSASGSATRGPALPDRPQRYVDDIRLPEWCTRRSPRSPHAHADIVGSFDLAAGRKALARSPRRLKRPGRG